MQTLCSVLDVHVSDLNVVNSVQPHVTKFVLCLFKQMSGVLPVNGYYVGSMGLIKSNCAIFCVSDWLYRNLTRGVWNGKFSQRWK